MGNSQQFHPETGFSFNQNRTEDFVITNANLTAPSPTDSVLSRRADLPLDQPLVWNQDLILNTRNADPEQR